MTLSDERLREHLKRPLRYYPSVASSNDLAADWLREGAPTGAVVVADEQREGRGRKGRVWYTPPGVALALSVILRPPLNSVTRVSMVGALAVAGALDELGIADVGIKWPNDVQIGGKKVCGVLPEAIWQGERLLGVVLGMGVNVRVAFADDIRDTAINVEDALGASVDRVALIGRVLTRVDRWSAEIDGAHLFEMWRARLNMLGRRVNAEGAEGVALRVEPDGALILRNDEGQERRVMAGDLDPLE